MGIKKHLPNGITLLNLLSGSIAVLCAVDSNFLLAAFFMFLGIFFDFFDGFFARLLKVKSDLGLQLDSLADMVTSGLVPGIVMYKLLSLSLESGEGMLEETWTETLVWMGLKAPTLAFTGLFITLASAYRLAKFNLDEDQQTYFKGLPTPANAILILSFPLVLEFQGNHFLHSLILNPWFLIALTLLSCYLLNSQIQLFALKFSDWSFKNNAVRYLFMGLTLVLLLVFKFIAVPLIIALYIVLSLFIKPTEHSQNN